MSKHRTRTTGWNRFLSGVLCLALALGLLPAAGMVQTAEAAHWADPYAEQLVDWGILQPAEDLRLSDNITRAEFVAMCNRAFGYNRLGGTPFIDVPASAWYAQDIDIAYNAGYFNGGSANMAYPGGTLSREQAAVLIARNLMLQEAVGEGLDFPDSRDLSDWSRGLVSAAASEGLINGLPDGSFSPANSITRGEVAAMVVRAVGNPISAPGNYELGDRYGNVIINSSDVTLRDTVILGNLYVTGGVDLGNVMLENVTVLGRIVISGGGVSDAARSSVILRNVDADELVIDSMVDQFVTISAYGVTDIPLTNVRSDAYLEDSCSPGYGLKHIEQTGAGLLQISGGIKEVVNKTPGSTLHLVKGAAEKITIDEYATNSETIIDVNTRVDELNLDVATLVTGKGDIIDLNIAAAGCEVDILPEHVTVRPGISASVDGDTINSVDAAELSSEPRLMAGYPKVDSLKPTSAEGLFSGNKPGTIYWAVSELADGSVDTEDLIHNPAYGGNIFKDGETYQSGSVDASRAKAEYGRLISGLEPDGSYYISAILVDERNNRSPLKVISFSTPDDTVPAFVEEPHMTKSTCEIAQVTTMVNKSCVLYWVLLPAGAAVPTPQNFKSGSFGGNYGYGSQSVVKNVPVSITVNNGRLQESTDYDVYLWLNDFDGSKSSEVKHVVNKETKNDKDPTFTTPDETPPVVTDLYQYDFSQKDSIGFAFTINEAPVTLYWAVVTATDTTFIKSTDSAQRAQLKVENGEASNAIVSGSMAVNSANVEARVTAAEFLRIAAGKTLDPSDPKVNGTHNFRMYYMAKDADGNRSEVKSIIVHTLDNEPPTVTIDYSSAMYNTEADKAAGRKPQPQADSDIILIFSEQVKGEGGETARTFVDLYSDVARYEGLNLPDTPGSLLYSAKNALGEELKKHITLINVQGRKENDLKEPQKTDDGKNSLVQEEYGWVDFREATVELLNDGGVALTLPGGKAVQMGGGMQYYFYFENIFDDSYTSNPLTITRSDGTVDGGVNASGVKDTDCFTDTFTTVYAQVWLDPADEDVPTITNSGDLLNGTRLDIVVDVTPQSAGSAVSDDRWDMVMWSDTSAEFDLYRRVKDSNGWSSWEKVNDNHIKAGKNIAVSLGAVKSANYLDGEDRINGETYKHEQFETIKDGLLKDVVYEYGVCFTSINNDSWEGTKKEPEAWSSLVTMRFSLVAGNRTNITNLSRSVDLQYDNYVKDGSVNEIGSVRSDTATETILSISKQFSDKRPPAFRTNSPTFTATSSTITMNVFLDRTGYLYYLAIPAVELFPSFKNDGKTVDITSDAAGNTGNDGSSIDKGNVPSNQSNPTADVAAYIAQKKQGKTYIPLGGKDRDDNGDYIYFVSGGNKTTAAAGAFNGIYSAPIYDEIFDGATYANSSQNAVAGSYQYTARTDQLVTLGGEDQHNLKPDTWYYVYIVLRSDSGTFDDIVQVYRVKTAATEPPAIVVNRTAVPQSESGVAGGSSTTGVSMTVNNRGANTSYDNPMLYYALARKDELPSTFTDVYKWGRDASEGDIGETTANGIVGAVPAGKTPLAVDEMTVLDAIITKYNGTNLSYFDQFAGSTLKNWVRDYITTATTSNQYGSTLHGYDPVNGNFKRQECIRDMQGGGEYVMLVCARHYYGTESDGTQYGFAATQGLFKPDGEPPVLIGGGGLREADIKNAYTYLDNVDKNWRGRDSLTGYSFTGSILLSFDKAIYTYENGTLKQIVGGTSKTAGFDSKTQTALIDWINSSAGTGTGTGTAATGFTSVTMSGNSFTIEFTKIASGTITFPPLFNSSGVEQTEHTLYLTFRPLTTLGDLENAYGDTAKLWMPAFRVNW